jgi:hypothetical protein
MIGLIGAYTSPNSPSGVMFADFLQESIDALNQT